MFANSKVQDLDLSKFNTKNVTTMSGMFKYTSVEKLDLDTFDTRSVENMNSMFYGNKSSTLDLSSFILKEDVDLTSMFGIAKARIGYAKDEKSINKFNDNTITSISSTLKFVVK